MKLTLLSVPTTRKNSTNKTIAEAIGWRKCEERSDGTLFGLCPDSKPWPEEGCFNCPKEVPDYEKILLSNAKSRV